MNSNNEYWFQSYDREFVEKEFIQMNFWKYQKLVTSLPQFREIPTDYPLSNQPLEYEFQVRVANIIGELMILFNPTNPAINSMDKQWIDFVQQTQYYINCEKYYCLIFWRLNLNNQFVMKRILGFYIRFCKFLEAFQQALFKGLSEKEKKNKTLEQSKDQIHTKFNSLKQFIDIIIDEVNQVYEINKEYNTQDKEESLLFKKLKLILKMFLSYSKIQLENNLKKNYSDMKLIYQILHQNELSIKNLDKYQNKYEKESFQIYQDEKKIFESSNSKTNMEDNEKRYYPQEEPYVSENMFWEKVEQVKTKNKKATHTNGIPTNRDQTTQQSILSNNTEVTDDLQFQEGEDNKQHSNTKSFLSVKDFNQKNDKFQNQNNVDSSTFKDTPNYPNVLKNPMMEFLVSETSEFYKNNQKLSKQGSYVDDIQKMKYGNENKRDIEKSLKKRKISQQNEIDEDPYDEDSGFEDMEDEDDEQDGDDNQDQNNTYVGYNTRRSELNEDLLKYVKDADLTLVKIQDKDIDFDQNKTKGLHIKRADEVTGFSNNRFKTTSNPDNKSANNSQINQESIQNQEINILENEGLDEDNDDQEETSQNDHNSECLQEYKDDDIFDYSYEKDDDDYDEYDSQNNSQQEDESYEENDNEDEEQEEEEVDKVEVKRESVVDKDKVKMKVPFTQFKSQIENSFIQFLKESLYSQDNEQEMYLQDNAQSSSFAHNQQKKKAKVSLKTIFPDIRVVYMNGYNLTKQFNRCLWMESKVSVQKNLHKRKVFKINKYFNKIREARLTQDEKSPNEEDQFIIIPPQLNRKKLTACEQKQINS